MRRALEKAAHAVECLVDIANGGIVGLQVFGITGEKIAALARFRIKHLLHQFVDGSAGLLGFFNVLDGAGRLLKTRFIDEDQDGRCQNCQRQADGHSGD